MCGDGTHGPWYVTIDAAEHCVSTQRPGLEENVSRKFVSEFVAPGERIEKKFVDEMIVSCPWHGWAFDLETGENIADGNIVLPAYEVVVKDGVVFVDDGK